MDKIEVTVDVLKKCWEEHCEYVGDPKPLEVARTVYAGIPAKEAFQPAAGGADLSFEEALKILVEAATFVKLAIDIYIATRDQLGRKPYPKEVDEKVVAQNAERSQLPSEAKRIEAIEEIAKRV